MKRINSVNELSPDEVLYQNNLICSYTEIAGEREMMTDTDDAAMAIVNGIKEFYQADWVGILHVDLNLNIFRVLWWNSTRSGPYGKTLYNAYDGTEMFGRWQETMLKHQTVIIDDVEALAADNQEEYAFLKENHVHSILAFPIYGEDVGSILVRNPERYLHEVDLLRMMTPDLKMLLARKKAIGITHRPASDTQDCEHNLLVRFFGKPEMNIYGNIIESEKIRCTASAWETLYYLNRHKYQSFNAHDLVIAVMPDAYGTANEAKRLRNKMSCLSASFQAAYGSNKALFKNDNAPKNSQDYTLNLSIGLQFDYELFSLYIDKYNHAGNDLDRLEFLGRAMDLYRGDLFGGKPINVSNMPAVDEYHRIYVAYMEKYLELLLKTGCYEKASNFSWQAMNIEPDYYLLYATAYVALVQQNMRGRANDAMSRAIERLTQDAFTNMLNIVKEYLPEEDMEHLTVYTKECPDEETLGK